MQPSLTIDLPLQYNTGNGKIIPTTTDPLHFDDSAPLITFPAPVSHPHMALEHNSEVLVPDLVSHFYFSHSYVALHLLTLCVAGWRHHLAFGRSW